MSADGDADPRSRLYTGCGVIVRIGCLEKKDLVVRLTTSLAPQYICTMTTRGAGGLRYVRNSQTIIPYCKKSLLLRMLNAIATMLLTVTTTSLMSISTIHCRARGSGAPRDNTATPETEEDHTIDDGLTIAQRRRPRKVPVRHTLRGVLMWLPLPSFRLGRTLNCVCQCVPPRP